MAAIGLRSCVVAWLRVLLPLAALAVLSTLFLLSRHPDGDHSVPYADVDAEARARMPQITAPSWSGVTADGAQVTLAARKAVPGGDDHIGQASGLHLSLRATDGMLANITAPDGRQSEDRITLDGGVAVVTSTGWRLNAPTITATTDRSDVEATGGIEAQGPLGMIQAEAASLRLAGEGEATHHVLDFTGGVRLVYRP